MKRLIPHAFGFGTSEPERQRRAARRPSLALRLGQCARLAVLVFLICLGRAAADWPHLRGPNYDGIAAEAVLANAWPAEGPPRLWSRELGQGYSGFIVADGKLFTQCQSLGGQTVLCLDPDTGATIWEHRYDWAWHSKGAYPGPYATPTWYRGKIYYASTSGLVGCLEAATGAPIWSLNVLQQFKGKGCGFGFAATPLVEDDRVILPVGGVNASVVALHANDGRTLWATGSDPASYCPALPITFQGRRTIVGYLQNALVLVDATTGKLLHRQPMSAGYDEHSAWPIWREPHLALTGPFRVPATRFEIQAGPNDALECQPGWTSKEMSNDVASSVLFDGHLYGFDLKQLQASKHRASRGAFKCLDWATGKVCWSTEEVGHASVIVADRKLILFNDTGSLILARADPTKYHELARTQLFADEICWTPATLWRGKLFVRSPSQAICVYVGPPDARPIPQTAVSAPPIRTSRLDASWLLTREREFPNDAPTWGEMWLWFGACLLSFAVAALAAYFTPLRVGQAFQPDCQAGKPDLRGAGPGGRGWIFLGLAFLLGMLGPNALSVLADQCVFTWPASLYAAFHATLAAYGWDVRQTTSTRTRWLARGSVIAFLLVNWGYYEACKSVGMFVAWSFLVGYAVAFPAAVLAVRASAKDARLWIVAGWTLVAFTLYFWSGVGLLLWKAARGE